MSTAAPSLPGIALRWLAAWLTRTADRLERPAPRALALEPAPLDASIEERLARIRVRYY